jgi:hypothetical protein
MSAKTTVAEPVASKARVVAVDLVVITGAIASITFTVYDPLVTLPAASVAVTVITVEGMSAHVKVYLLKATVGTSQLSSEDVTTSGTEMVAVPDPFKYTVKAGAVVYVGAILSTTVTTAVNVVAFPFTSVAVTKTLFAPLLVQSKSVLLKVTTGTPQLSDLESTTSDSPTIAFPLAFKIAVNALVTKEGANSSLT